MEEALVRVPDLSEIFNYLISWVNNEFRQARVPGGRQSHYYPVNCWDKVPDTFRAAHTHIVRGVK